MVEVHYNGSNPFLGISPTPFVAINDDMVNYGQRWGAVQKITLKGMLTGACNPSYGNNQLLDNQQSLFNSFSTDFKKLEIIDSNSTVFSADYAKIDSVDFDASSYVAGVPFRVNITAFPSNMFSGVYGVLDPVSVIRYSQQNNGIVNISRNVSAKGFNTSNTSNNALDNARNYVQSLTGTAIIPPHFISLTPNLCPRKVAENINRMEGTYGVDIDYTQRINSSSSALLSYSVDISYEEERGIYNVALKGNLNGGECRQMSDLRNDYTKFRPYDIASTNLYKQVGNVVLNPEPDNFSIEEDEAGNTINFSYAYTTDPQQVKFDYSVDIQNEYLSDKANVTLNGSFVARGPQATRMSKAESALANFNPLPICQAAYNNNISNQSVPLNPNYKSYNITRDLTSNIIKVQASFDNSITLAGAKIFNYTISITPSLNAFGPIQFLDGSNGFFDLKYFKRGKMGIQGSAVYGDSSDYTGTVRSVADGLLRPYLGAIPVLTESKVERKIQSEDNGYVYSFNITYTCETAIFQI